MTKLYAKYDINKFDVTFDTDGANEAAPQQQNVDYNGKVTAPTGTFTKDDKYEDGIRTTYTFAGWYNGDVEYDFNAAVTSALTLKIKWTEAYTYDVTFNAMGATQKLPQVQYIDNNGLVTEPQDPAKYGYVLDGWFTKDGTNDDWGTEWNFASDKITAVTTLYAKWTLEEKYTVTFDSMGGSPITNQIVIAGNPASEPVDPTKDNNKFIGWYTSDDEGQTLSDNPYDFAELVTGDLTLYAKWTQTTRKVIFYVGDDEYETIDNVEYGTVIDENDLPADPTLTGHTFAGWYTNQELTQSFNVKYDEVICDELEFNLYAKFRLSKYQVTFDTDGGSTISSQRVEYGKSATKPQDPTKDGFIFAGWYNDGLTEEYDFAAPITGVTTIYAKWEVVISSNTILSNSVDTDITQNQYKLTKDLDFTTTPFSLNGALGSHTSGAVQFAADTTISFNVNKFATITVDGYDTGYGKFDIWVNGIYKETSAGTHSFSVFETSKIEIKTYSEDASHSYLYGISVSYPSKYIDQTTTINFGDSGNYKTIEGLTYTSVSRDNGGDNSQLGNTSGELSFFVKAGAEISISSYAGYTNYKVFVNTNESEVQTGTSYSFTATEDSKITIVSTNSNNYFYSLTVSYKVVISNASLTFGENGNYKDSDVSEKGFIVNCTIGDNGGNNSQVKNGTISFWVKSGSKLTINGYPGFTKYSLNIENTEITNELYEKTFDIDTYVTITIGNVNNYFYSIVIE